ncbi:hypothetical protein GYA49_00380 [Candidatus Beckwithbacteria bacterium]|nr:hypothetical protein [Candidatus Beckwithbacteria bacterium]
MERMTSFLGSRKREVLSKIAEPILIILLSIAQPASEASAQNPATDNNTAIIDIVPGFLEISPSFSEGEFNIKVSDARGTGAGWSLSMQCSGLPESCPTISNTEPITIIAGQDEEGTMPSSSLNQLPIKTSDEPLTILSAGQDQGMGTYIFSPQVVWEGSLPDSEIIILTIQ